MTSLHQTVAVNSVTMSVVNNRNVLGAFHKVLNSDY
jgi:hypothetical protein